jgi:phosphoribosylformimino-5-aminoimidazole carboxamide ribotide isomerase
MLLIPAIDLKDGHCVRLKQGAMEDATVFSEDPAAMARHWIDKGARRLHLVDLNGAFAGKPKNEAAIKAILNRGWRRDSGATRWRHPRSGYHRALPR